jgi:transcriptional regulator with XRE-family HTH domain
MPYSVPTFNSKVYQFCAWYEMTPAQCRAARGLVNWSQSELGERSDLGLKTIADFEREAKKRPYRRTLDAITAAFEAAGVEFINRGVRMRADRGRPRAPRD